MALLPFPYAQEGWLGFSQWVVERNRQVYSVVLRTFTFDLALEWSKVTISQLLFFPT